MGIFLTLTFALVISLSRELKNRGSDAILLVVWKYLSYYTILTNLLVWFWLLTIEFGVFPSLSAFAQDANVSTAIVFYLVTVGLGNYLLYGWQRLALLDRISDLFAHGVTPLLTLLYWAVHVDKTDLHYNSIGWWLVYPLCYAAYTAFHGVWTHFYPYEFTNVRQLGATRVALNALGLSILLLVGGAGFIALGRSIG